MSAGRENGRHYDWLQVIIPLLVVVRLDECVMLTRKVLEGMSLCARYRRDQLMAVTQTEIGIAGNLDNVRDSASEFFFEPSITPLEPTFERRVQYLRNMVETARSTAGAGRS